MMTQENERIRTQVQLASIDDLVPKDHLLRAIDKAINWNFIYDLVRDKYSENNGRPSIDPVMLIKIPFIQYLYGIKSIGMKELYGKRGNNRTYLWNSERKPWFQIYADVW